MINLDDVKAKFGKEAGFSGSVAIFNFLEDNKLSLEDISVTILKENKKLLIRVPSWNVSINREAEKNIYHGAHYDIFFWTCMTSKSGILEWNEDVTYDYKLHCRE